jgi:subtilase family serine protease
VLFGTCSHNRLIWGFTFIAGALLALPALHAQTKQAQTTQAQTKMESPKTKIAELSGDRGPAFPSLVSTITVHLKMHNEDAFDKAFEALYTPGSSTYHQWMTQGGLAEYAPTTDEIEAVKTELTSHGLSILSVGSDKLSIRARGSVASIESAFQTQIHEFEREGKIFHANITPPELTGSAGNLVESVSGLSNFPLKSMLQHPVDPTTGKKLPTFPLTDVPTITEHFTNNCFPGPESLTLTILAGAPLPVGQYYGNVYKSDPAFGHGHVCGWTPAQVRAHYGLTAAYKQGIDGKGETIVIVDGPSDPTVQNDLAQFSQLYGLPAITSSNFRIVYPDGQPSQWYLNNVANWDEEADLDIEWAHAIAPKANIVLLITPTQDWSELEYAIQYAQENKLGNVISNSYGYPEMAWGAYTLNGFNQVLKKAAAQGIAVNFASGDFGDLGTGSPDGGGAEFPATSQYVTAIGGTSIGIPNGTSTVEVGWGNNAAEISNGYGVLDPPFFDGYQSGSGGGVSGFISKPSWQKSLPGSYRQIPDISALADPYTGGITVLSGQVGAIGGTSLATPIFSAIWALADQKAGKSLGQAAPLIEKLPSTAVTDIVPFGSATNPAGIIFDSNGSTYYSSDTLLAPLDTTTTYYSAMWFFEEIPGYVVLSFGTDSSLTVTPGWDNVTGWGVPNGWAFITAAAAKK